MTELEDKKLKEEAEKIKEELRQSDPLFKLILFTLIALSLKDEVNNNG